MERSVSLLLGKKGYDLVYVAGLRTHNVKILAF